MYIFNKNTNENFQYNENVEWQNSLSYISSSSFAETNEEQLNGR